MHLFHDEEDSFVMRNYLTTADKLLLRIVSILSPFVSVCIAIIAKPLLASFLDVPDIFFPISLVMGIPIIVAVAWLFIAFIILGFLAARLLYEKDRDNIFTKIIYFTYIILGSIAVATLSITLVIGVIYAFLIDMHLLP